MINDDRSLPNLTERRKSISVNLDNEPMNTIETISQYSVRLEKDKSTESFMNDKDNEDEYSQVSKESNNIYK